MCDCDIGEAPACYTERIRTARKDHRCSECRRRIRAGEKYKYVSGIWDGYPSSYKTCSRCQVATEAHIAAEYNLDGEHCVPILGSLIESIRDCIEPEYLRLFRAARREILDGKKPTKTWQPPPSRYRDVLMGRI